MAPKRNAIRMRVFLHVLDLDCFCRASIFLKNEPGNLSPVDHGWGGGGEQIYTYIYMCVYTHINIHIYICVCIFI